MMVERGGRWEGSLEEFVFTPIQEEARGVERNNTGEERGKYGRIKKRDRLRGQMGRLIKSRERGREREKK